jgi:transketolase
MMTAIANNWDALRPVADTIRVLAMDAVQTANSGHPGMPMGMADTAAVLWANYLKFDSTEPKWPDRDRFVLSAGHGSMLIYALLHLSGYDLPLDELKNFRQWGSRTPGHPEYGHTIGVETTTGPLGQGISNAVGMALAERWLAARFNRPSFTVVDHRTFVIAGDGDLMEGISHEACSFAGHLGLGRLILLYDDNQICIDGPTSLSYSEDALARFASYGWQVTRVDGHNPAEVAAALNEAIADESRPSLIACRTVIGHGSPNRAGTSKAHGEPLGWDEIALTKEGMGWPTDERFHVLPEAYDILGAAGQRGANSREEWEEMLELYNEAFPRLAAEFKRACAGELPAEWESHLPTNWSSPLATRAASGKVLNSLVPNIPDLLGGSADLTGSNKTKTKNAPHLEAGNYGGRYIHYGVREHGMGAIMNGMALHGVIPYGGTFLVFSDYMRHAIRLSSLMELGVIYVFTHDSIGLGEDGPTHQPIEHLASLRAIPNLAVIRPADGAETTEAWKVALKRRHAPTALVLTRQKLPQLSGDKAAGVANGAYILSDVANPQVILIGTGSEVEIAVDAQQLLAKQGVQARVVSMPCWRLFEEMPQGYKDEVLPPSISARVSVEAAGTLGWERYVGWQGATIGINRFGASAPYKTIYRELGITAEAVAAAAMNVMR